MMTRIFFFLVCFLWSLSFFGQELGKVSTLNPRPDLNFEPSDKSVTRAPHLGQFQLSYLHLPTNLSFNREQNRAPINILAMGLAAERHKQANMRQMNFPERQLQQIKSRVQIFNGRESFLNRTDNNLNFYGGNTPDGGIRNEVYEDVRQPLINPYFGLYDRRNFGYRSRSSFQLYRR